MRKLIAWIIAAVLILTIPVAAFAENTDGEAPPADAAASPSPTPEPTPVPTETPAETSEVKEGAPAVDMSQITSISAALVDADTGEVLFSKNADWTIFPASTTKLMTAILVAENCKMDDTVTLTSEILTEAGKINGSLMGLYRSAKVGSTVSVKDLFYGLLLCSGNDAAVALGMHVAGTEQAFVDMMNAKAQELGMTGTHFINPHGAYIYNVGQDHYTTAADMAKLAAEAKKYPEITEAESVQTYTYETLSGFTQVEGLPPDTIENSNYLIHTPVQKPYCAQYLYDKATGMKTGTINNIMPPGYTERIPSYGCLVASASDNGLNLIAVIFGDLSLEEKQDDAVVKPDAYARWDIAKYLFDYGFSNFAKVDLSQYASAVALTEQIAGVSGNDPEKGELEVKADLSGIPSETQLMDAATVQGLKEGTIKLEEKTNITEPLIAPISEGQQVGTVSYLLDGKELYSAPLIAGRAVYPLGEEEETSEEYGVPVHTFELWYLWIIIPAGLILAFLVVRLVNISRRKARYAARSAYPPQGRRTGANSTVQRRNVGTRTGGKASPGRRQKM